MRVHIATDHAAFELKEYLVRRLRADGVDVVDHGAATLDPDDDYPPFILACAEAVVAEPGSLGIVLGGSGNGEQIAANKVSGVRAALGASVDLARLAREHNDAYAVGKLDTVEYNERLLASSILFLIAGTVVALNVVIWLLASISARELLYFWPMWVAVGMVVPVVIGAALRRSAD